MENNELTEDKFGNAIATLYNIDHYLSDQISVLEDNIEYLTKKKIKRSRRGNKLSLSENKEKLQRFEILDKELDKKYENIITKYLNNNDLF